jgi:hypothetical protein
MNAPLRAISLHAFSMHRRETANGAPVVGVIGALGGALLVRDAASGGNKNARNFLRALNTD